MNILNLFDGISCGQVALKRARIKVNNYYASEIDKYCIQITQKNYPNTIQIGDITKVSYKDNILYTEKSNFEVSQIDLIMGGSPCQGFSFAGKHLNFGDSRSKLFFEFVRILKEVNPKYFLLENVKMKKEYQNIISKELKVEPILINSALVSAQNRNRLYWTNIPNIIQPKKKYIYLKDILEFQPSQKYNLSQKTINTMLKWSQNYKCIGKAATLTTELAHSTGKNVTPKNDKEIIYANSWCDKDKSYCIDANYWKGTTLQHYKDKKVRQLVFNKMNWRKLTPIECERLQTLPDNYTEDISNTQRYKCLGNGWTVDIIVHILKGLL